MINDYNENEESYLSRYKRTGMGNAIIRPYRFTTPQRACCIPTGSNRKGYSSLTSHVTGVIDTAFVEIEDTILKYGYTRVMFSSNEEGRIGMSIFHFSDYITDKLYDIENNFILE